MKQVFIIHSHTTFLVSMGVIKKLSLPDKDIVLLYGRNYKISCIKVPYTVIDITKIYDYCKLKRYIWSYSKQLKHIHLIDNLIAECIKTEYNIYIPHTSYNTFQLLLTNPLCSGLNLIQEGAVSFFSKKIKYKQILKNIITFYNSRIWFKTNWYIPNKFYKRYQPICTFATNKLFFEPLKKAHNHIIKIPHYHTNIVIEENEPIFIFESAVEMQLIEREIYMSACYKMITECSQTRNYIKFHPNQDDINISTIKSFFNDKRYIELPMDVPVELILSTNRKLTICGFTSSLIFFAKEMHHIVNSYTKELTGNSNKFKRYVDSMHKE